MKIMTHVYNVYANVAHMSRDSANFIKHPQSSSPEAAQFTVSAAFASRVAVPSMAFTLQRGRIA